jgi:hypothetical protein
MGYSLGIHQWSCVCGAMECRFDKTVGRFDDSTLFRWRGT